jgi:hypothetical protein
MKDKAGKLAGIVGLLSLCLTVPGFGQAATVDFTSAASVFDPYQGTVIIGGVTQDNYDLIVCDDATHDISAPESWTANAILVSNLNTTPASPNNVDNTFFGSAIGLTGYTKLAAVANAILTGQTSLAGVSNLTDADLSEALWIIAAGAEPGGVTESQAAKNLVTALGSDSSLSLSTYSDLYVLTPTGDFSNKALYPFGTPQEMFTLVPEGGTAALYLLLAGLACLGTMRLSSRNIFGSRAAA